MKSNTNITPIVITILIVIAGVYWFFFTGKGNQKPISTVGTENQVQTQFQMLVGKLTPISFNTSIFSDARFNSLVNLATPISPEPSGRLDPFAVVMSTSVNASTGASKSGN